MQVTTIVVNHNGSHTDTDYNSIAHRFAFSNEAFSTSCYRVLYQQHYMFRFTTDCMRPVVLHMFYKQD